jgi:hypothetical protein
MLTVDQYMYNLDFLEALISGSTALTGKKGTQLNGIQLFCLRTGFVQLAIASRR